MSALTDYYSILELPPSASLDEIRKAYRRLALIYHPDIASDEPAALERFKIIKEAYEILSNTGRKEEYLQERWYAKSMGKAASTEFLSPESILKQLLKLDLYLSRLDIHRMDKVGVNDHLIQLFSDKRTSLLNGFADKEINNRIVEVSLRLSVYLLPEDASKFRKTLQEIHADADTLDLIRKQEERTSKQIIWEKRKIWLLLLAVAAICLLIYFGAN